MFRFSILNQYKKLAPVPSRFCNGIVLAVIWSLRFLWRSLFEISLWKFGVVARRRNSFAPFLPLHLIQKAFLTIALSLTKVFQLRCRWVFLLFLLWGLGYGLRDHSIMISRDTWCPGRFCSRIFNSPTRLIFHSPFYICFVDQTSADEMVTAVLKSCIAGILVFSFCTAGIMKITNKIAPQAYEQMVSCLVDVQYKA